MGKKLGQHFLRNLATAKKIVASLELEPGNIIIEVGPGHGELTQEIKNKISNLKTGIPQSHNCRVIAIEKDPQLVNELRERFLKDTKIEILEGDVRTILPRIFNGEPTLYPKPPKGLNPRTVDDTLNPSLKLIGNIPYYLTGLLLRTVSELPNPPIIAVFMVQKEVAERIVAIPPHMNRLAAITQYWAETKIVGIVPRDQFNPPPEVDSAIIMLKNRAKLPIPKETYFLMAKILFAQPRKTIVNNLVAASSALRIKTKEGILEALAHLGIGARARPQDLSIEAIVNLSSELFDTQKSS